MILAMFEGKVSIQHHSQPGTDTVTMWCGRVAGKKEVCVGGGRAGRGGGGGGGEGDIFILTVNFNYKSFIDVVKALIDHSLGGASVPQ